MTHTDLDGQGEWGDRGGEARRADLLRVLAGLRLRVGEAMQRDFAAPPPQVMQALTAVSVADLVAELPGPVRRAVHLAGRRGRVAAWLAMPVFTCALILGGSLRTTDPLRFMLLELPLRLPSSRRGAALVSIGIHLDPAGPGTRARVLLLGGDRRSVSYVPSAVLLRIAAPAWRACTGAWLKAAVSLVAPSNPRPSD